MIINPCGYPNCKSTECQTCQFNKIKEIPDEDLTSDLYKTHELEQYRDSVLKTIREYEKDYDPVKQYEIVNAIDYLYEKIRAL